MKNPEKVKRMNKKNVLAALPLLFVVSLTGCGTVTKVADTEIITSPSVSSTTPEQTTSNSSSSAETALDALNKLNVVEEENASTYDRDEFKHWTTAPGSSCDTRFAVLVAESTVKTKISGCTVISGNWISSYDGKTVTDPSGLDIDHMVPLKEAWRSGASGWDAKTREAYANDLNYENSLVAVTAASNRSKSDNDPSEWLPPVKDNHCTYVSHWITVKTKWNLNVNSAEKTAIKKVLDSCGPTPLVESTGSAAPVTTTTPTTTDPVPAAPVTTTTSSAPVADSTGGNDPKFSNCTEAVSAGYGNYTTTDPEYAWYRDGDGDGIACEK